MKVAVHQPNCIPWGGYFRKIFLSDIFVLYDDVQFEKGGYTNRVKLRIAGDARWLTQPVVRPSGVDTKIYEIIFASDDSWALKHLKTIELNYSKSPFYKEVIGLVECIYDYDKKGLAEFNGNAIKLICAALGFEAKIVKSSNIPYDREGSASEKLISICKLLGGTSYLSGRGARAYNDALLFEQNGIDLTYDEWSLGAYSQPEPILPGLSVLDTMFNIGIEGTSKYIKGLGEG